MAKLQIYVFRIYVFVYKYMYVLHPYNLGGGAHRNSMGKENVRTSMYYFFLVGPFFRLKVWFSYQFSLI